MTTQAAAPVEENQAAVSAAAALYVVQGCSCDMSFRRMITGCTCVIVSSDSTVGVTVIFVV